MAGLGNTSPSNLVKSAAGIHSQIESYNDSVAAAQWSASAKTDADYQTYSNYLSTKLDTVSKNPGIANASRAVALGNTLRGVRTTYVGNQLSRVTDQILQGNATPVDKQNLIREYYNQAVNIGDESLAQSLMFKFNSLDQQIQYNEQVAANAAETLQKANFAAQTAGYENAISALKSSLDDFSHGFSQVGQSAVTGQLQKSSDTIKTILKANGITLPEGSNLNNGSIISAAIQGIGQLTAAEADYALSQPNGTDTYNKKASEAQDIFNGQTKFTVGNTSFDINTAQLYANNTQAVRQVRSGEDMAGNPTYDLKVNPVIGYSYDKQGNLQPIFNSGPNVTNAEGTTLVDKTLSESDPNGANNRKKTEEDLKSMGFTSNIDAKTGKIIILGSDDQNNKFFQDAIKQYGFDPSVGIEAIKTDSGYQLEPITDNQGIQRLLSINKDASGAGIYSSMYNPTTGMPVFNKVSNQPGYIGSNQFTITPITEAKAPSMLNVKEATNNGELLPVTTAKNNGGTLNVTTAKNTGGLLPVGTANSNGMLDVISAPINTNLNNINQSPNINLNNINTNPIMQTAPKVGLNTLDVSQPLVPKNGLTVTTAAPRNLTIGSPQNNTAINQANNKVNPLAKGLKAFSF